MNELRRDPITETWVIIATERAKRPSDFGSVEEAHRPGPCVFCEGRESETPPEIWAKRASGAPNSAGWSVRVLPNKFAALRIEGEVNKRGEGIYDKMNGIGAHEVLVETPLHSGTLVTLPMEAVVEILKAYQLRVDDLRKDKRFKYVQVFKNYGSAAGASLDHPHSQIIALPVTPRWVKEELQAARRYYSLKERCLFCDISAQEAADPNHRVAVENEGFIALLPFASRFPFETWILPRRHRADFTTCEESELWQLADVLTTVLRGLKQAINDPPYNYVLHTASIRRARQGYWDTIDDDYHWHIEIIPRLTKLAGFEWGTGFYINPTPPEIAADILRGAAYGEEPEGEG